MIIGMEITEGCNYDDGNEDDTDNDDDDYNGEDKNANDIWFLSSVSSHLATREWKCGTCAL